MSRGASVAIVGLVLSLSSCEELWGPWPGGIGAVLRYRARDRALTVVDVPPGAAAARAGVRRGDRVIAIDGEELGDLEAGTVVERLRGPVGTRVRLTIVRDGRTDVLWVERAPYHSD